MNTQSKKTSRAKISTKYQIVIPKEARETASAMKIGEGVRVYALDKNTIVIKANSKKNWINRAGGIIETGLYGDDPTEYIRNLRDTWGERTLPWKK